MLRVDHYQVRLKSLPLQLKILRNMELPRHNRLVKVQTSVRHRPA